MLVKVGSLYLTLGTFIFNEHSGDIIFHDHTIPLSHESEVELKAVLDSVIAAQQSIDEQVKLQKEATEKLNSELQRIAAYERDLMQKAAQVDAAYAAMQQQKSPPMILPAGFGRKRS